MTPQQKYRAKQRAAGKCIQCGAKKSKAVRCDRCAEAHAAAERDRRAKMIADGKCERCGGPAAENRRTCKECGMEHAERERNRYRERVKQ